MQVVIDGGGAGSVRTMSTGGSFLPVRTKAAVAFMRRGGWRPKRVVVQCSLGSAVAEVVSIDPYVRGRINDTRFDRRAVDAARHTNDRSRRIEVKRSGVCLMQKM